MCFVSPVKARFLALLLAVLAVLGQQRVVTPVVHRVAPVARSISERAELIQSNAVRGEAASRLAPTPVLSRPPALPFVVPAAQPWPVNEPQGLLASLPRPGEVPRHFHSKRRIPRMNSEEPPRA